MGKRPRQDDAKARSGPRAAKRQFTDKDRTRASVFDQLADEKHETRIEAAKALLDEFAPAKNPDAEKLKSVFERLIRGLGSARKAARAGYFVALSEMLRQCATDEGLFSSAVGDVQTLMQVINKLTKANRDFPQENRDKLLGRVSAYKAILQSSILIESKVATLADWEAFLVKVCDQARTGPWLREECGSMLCDFVARPSEPNPDHEGYVLKAIDQYNTTGLLQTPEGVALWLASHQSYPDLKSPKDIWHNRDPLHSKERSRLARVMCDSVRNDEPDSEKKQQTKKLKGGTWKPVPHFAWRVVLQQAFAKYKSSSKLRQFCIEVVDNSLFAEKASSERKFLGFSLMVWAIGAVPLENLSTLFTPNFMRSLINQRADRDRNLYVAANGPLDAIVLRAEKDPDSVLKFLDIIVSSETSVHFDQVTKGNTLQRLISNVDDGNKPMVIDAIAEYIKEMPMQEQPKANEVGKARVVLANLLVTMASRHAKQNESVEADWTKKIAQILASFAYLTSTQVQPPISEDSRAMFHEAIVRCVNNLIPKLKVPGEWLASLVQYINKAQASSDYTLVLKADKSIMDSISAANDALRELHKKAKKATDEQQKILEMLQIFFSLTLLEVYIGDADATDMLSELQTCYASVLAQEADSQAFDLLVELLLSFLSRTTSLYRHVSEIIFPVLARGLSENGLESLLDIISKTENASGQEELFDATNGDGEDVADEDSDVEMDSDVEILSPSEDDEDDESKSKNKEDDSEDDDESDDDDSDSDDDDDDEEEDSELTQFNNLLAQTLKTTIPAASGEDEEDSSDDDESDMDDDQMMALDPQLAKIFQERRKAAGGGDGTSASKKKEKKSAKLHMALFKSRVLDLLQIYVKQQYSDPLACKAMLPLLALMRTTSSSDLESKARATLSLWWDTCDRQKAYPASSTDDLTQLFAEVHAEVLKEGSKIHDITCSRASLFMAKMLMTADSSNVGALMEQYGKTQIEAMQSGRNVQLAFFTEWPAWCLEWKKKEESRAVQENKVVKQAKHGETEKPKKSNKAEQKVAKKAEQESVKAKKGKKINGLKA